MLKKIIAPVVIAGALLGGVAVSTVAYAASPAASVTTASSGNHPLQTWLRAHRSELRRRGVAISAKTIGVTPRDLVAELRTGKSVAQVATEHSVSAQNVVNALDSAADTAITRAVTNHKLTQAQAQQVEAALPTHLAKAVDKVR